jgi:hypothetical protein
VGIDGSTFLPEFWASSLTLKNRYEKELLVSSCFSLLGEHQGFRAAARYGLQ